MLIPFGELIAKYDMDVMGVLHLGAHLAEEADAYDEAGVPTVVWIEGNPALIPQLRTILAGRSRHTVYQALVDDVGGNFITLHIANNGQSSSILPLGTHLQHHPEVAYVDQASLRTSTVDNLFNENHLSCLNFWNLDLQGAELKALRGAKLALNGCDYLYMEVNREQVYEGCPHIDDLDTFLTEFERVETAWTDFQWGDALWIRKGLG